MRQVLWNGTDSIAGTTAQYTSVMGRVTYSTTESAVRAPWPAPGVFRHLLVVLETAPGVGTTRTFTLRKAGVDTALTVTISGTATTGQLTGVDVTVAAGDLLTVGATVTGTPATTDVWFSLEFDGSTAKESGYSQAIGLMNNGSGDRGTGVFACPSTPATTANAAHARNVVAAAGTLTGMYATVATAPGVSNGVTFYVNKNGVRQDGTGGTVNTACVLVGAITAASVSYSLALAAGDLVYTEAIVSGTFTTRAFALGYAFEATTDGQSQVCGISSANLSTSATTHYPVPTGTSSGFSTEALFVVRAIGGVSSVALSGLQLFLPTAPGASKSRTFTLRNTGADTALTVTISGTATTGSDLVHTADIAAGDLWNWTAIPTSSPAATLAHWGLIQTTTSRKRGSSVFGVDITVTATRAAAFGLDGATNVHDEAGKLKVFGNFEVTGETTVEDLIVNGTFTLPAGSVTNTELADMAQSTIKGRAAGAGTGDPTDLSATQATAILNAVVGDSGAGGTKGLVPAPGAGDTAAGKFLKADGTFAVPGGSSSDSFKTIAVSGQSDVVADSATDTLTLVAGSNVTLTTNAGTDTVTIAASGSGGDSSHTAAYASRPAAGNDGDLFLPSDGFQLERDTGAVWVPWGPIFPLTAPIDGDFAWVNQGGASVATTNGGIFLSAPVNASTGWRIRKKSAPSTPYTLTVAILPYMMFVSFHRLGVLFRQSSDGKLVTFEVSYDSTANAALCKLVVNKWTNETTFSAEYTNILKAHPLNALIFLRISDDGTNRVCSYSTDGQHFRQVHTVGRTDFLTANEVGFGADPNNATHVLGLTLLSWKQA